MSLTVELSRDWESPIARHRDRYWFAGVDPRETDLPAALIEKLGAGEAALDAILAGAAPWDAPHPFARVAWVLRHLQRAGFVDLHSESLRGLPRPADDKYVRQTQAADPLYAAWGFVQHRQGGAATYFM